MVLSSQHINCYYCTELAPHFSPHPLFQGPPPPPTVEKSCQNTFASDFLRLPTTNHPHGEFFVAVMGGIPLKCQPTQNMSQKVVAMYIPCHPLQIVTGCCGESVGPRFFFCEWVGALIKSLFRAMLKQRVWGRTIGAVIWLSLPTREYMA